MVVITSYSIHYTKLYEAFSVAARIRSFRCALRGVRDTIVSQHNAWIHAVATVAACALGLLLDRFDALEGAPHREQTRESDRAAMATLTARGITPSYNFV